MRSLLSSAGIPAELGIDGVAHPLLAQLQAALFDASGKVHHVKTKSLHECPLICLGLFVNFPVQLSAQRKKHVLFALEIRVKRAVGNSAGLCDLLDGSVCQALFAHDCLGRVQKPPLRFQRGPLPVRHLFRHPFASPFLRWQAHYITFNEFKSMN